MSSVKLAFLFLVCSWPPLLTAGAEASGPLILRVEAEDPNACRIDGRSSVYEYPRSIGRRVLALEERSRLTTSGTGRAIYLCLPPTFQTPGPFYDQGTATKVRWRVDEGPAQDLWLATSPSIVALGEDLPPGPHVVEITAAEHIVSIDALVFAAEPLAAVRGVITTDNYSELLTDVRADLIAGGEVVRSEYLRNPVNGSFVLLDIAPGSYRLRFSANGWATAETPLFTVAKQGAKVDVGVIALPFDRDLVQQWSYSATTVRFRRTFNVEPGGTFETQVELAAPVRTARLVSRFKTLELEIEDKAQTPMPKSHDPLHTLAFHVPPDTPQDMYALEMKFEGKEGDRLSRWPQTVCVREPLPESFAVAGFGHTNTWGQQTSEFLAQMAEMAQLGGARTLLISNEVNAAYIAGALKNLRIPCAITAGNHTMSRWDDFFPQRCQSHDDGVMRIVTFGSDINDSWSEADDLFAERPDATARILACFEAHPPLELIRNGKIDLLFDGHGGGEHVNAAQFPPRTFHLRPPGQESILWFPMDHQGMAAAVEKSADVPRLSMRRTGPAPLRVEYSAANDGTATVLTARVVNETKIHFPGARLRLVMRGGVYSLSGAKVLQQFRSDDGSVTIIDAVIAVPPETMVEAAAKAQQ